MSRKVKINHICADCGANEPNWASLNTGVLICDECCSIHRTLGRQVSQVKSLKRCFWAATELQMVRDLYSAGSNTIFEQNLVDANNSSFTVSFSNQKNIRRKPCAKDALHPTKEDFIRSKYQNLAFINRVNSSEETQTEINEQLHSSVRAPNLKTSLRLLILGANPNFVHPEKGNTPLIVSTKCGLILQVELLLVYGADPLIRDVNGKTAFDYAIEGDHGVISQRLIDCQYELTDRLSYFLCGRRPDHLSDQHFVIPEMSDSIDVSDLAKDAKLKLQSLSNKVFQEIAKDVYDEVDRRELNEISLYTQGNISSDNLCVPFLPVTPQFSAIRNQGRQKLARYNARDFATLVIDILTESRRRQFGANENIKLQCQESNIKCKFSLSHTKSVEEDEDSEPVYDSVASDDESVDEKVPRCTENWCAPNAPAKLLSDETKIEQLLSSNTHLQRQIDHLYFVISKLTEDNAQLNKVEAIDNGNQVSSSNQSRLSRNYYTRPQSMFERHIGSGSKDISSDGTTHIHSKTLLFPHMNKNDILRITEVITKSIQELLAVALESRVELFLGCAQNVLQVVKSIHSSYREDSEERKVSLVTHTLVEKLYNSALTLYTRCNVDYAMIDKKQLSQQVIESAYDVAKAAKELITKVIN